MQHAPVDYAPMDARDGAGHSRALEGGDGGLAPLLQHDGLGASELANASRGSRRSRHSQRRGLARRKSLAALRTRFDLTDHFSLRSSVFRFGRKVVLSGVRHQLIFDLEENDPLATPRSAHRLEDDAIGSPGEEDRHGDGGASKTPRRVLISVKRASVYGSGVFLLKFLYSYVVVFQVGVALVFCILVFMQYGLGVFLVGIRSTNEMEERVATMASLISLPSFVNALSILITLTVGFLNDIWNNFEFLNTATTVPALVRDWLHITSAVLVPLGTFGVSFLCKADSPLSNMLLAALLCSFTLFVVCMLYTLSLQVYSSVKIIQKCHVEHLSVRDALRELVMHRLRHRFALTHAPVVELDEWLGLDGENVEEAILQRGLQQQQKLSPLLSKLYDPTPYRRLYTLENVLRPRPIMSKSEGSVLFLCCLTRSRFQGIISRRSLTSSLLCICATVFLAWLVFVGYMVYATYIPTPVVWAAAAGSMFLLTLGLRSTFQSVASFKRSNKIAASMHRRAARNGGSVGQFDLERSDTQNEQLAGEEGDGLDVEDGEASSISTAGTPDDLDIGMFGRAEALNAQKFVYAVPKSWFLVFLSAMHLLVVVIVPFTAFLYLGVGGYATFFAGCVVLNISLYIFNVPSLIEIFGARALETLELPFLDEFLEANDEAASPDAGAEESQMATQADDSGQESAARRDEAGPDAAGRASAQVPAREAMSDAVLGNLWSPRRQRRSARQSSNGRRIYLLLTRMTKVQVRNLFIYLFALSALLVIVLVALSVDMDTSASDYDGPELYGNASHRTVQMPHRSKMEIGFQYPVCAVLDDFIQPDGSGALPVALRAPLQAQDLAFLSDVAYARQETTQQKVDEWFGEGVTEYIPPNRYSEIAVEKRSAVVFKVFRTKHKIFWLDVDSYVIAIRGTTNSYDLLSDMQTWLPAMLFQALRFTLPFGSLWDSLIPTLIKFMARLEATPAKNDPLTFEADISRFVRALKAKNPRAHVLLTGHSLGAGLALIVGARNEVPAVGVSAPNALLSRLKFGISKDNLDKYTINLVPRGDPIPLIDEPALLTESVLCRLKRGESIGSCHEVTRTACELQYVCGSGKRPPLKVCNTTFDYPAPEPVKKGWAGVFDWQ